MRLVMVHGIAQETRDAPSLSAEWTGWLRQAMPDPRLIDRATVRLPFYGQLLDRLMRGAGQVSAVAQGLSAADSDPDELAFIAQAMDEAASAAQLSARDIALEQRAGAATAAVEQSLWMNTKVNAIARLLDKVSPVHGRWVLPLVRQAYAYLRQPGVAPAVDAVVMPELEAGPAIVVAHSLGTVVCFKLMRALGQAGRPVRCPLFVTLGSPLALRAVSQALGAPFQVPDGVADWVNAVEPGDAVTLGKALDGSTFCTGIENIMDIANRSTDSPHDVRGYLEDRRIAARIERALAAAP